MDIYSSSDHERSLQRLEVLVLGLGKTTEFRDLVRGEGGGGGEGERKEAQGSKCCESRAVCSWLRLLSVTTLKLQSATTHKLTPAKSHFSHLFIYFIYSVIYFLINFRHMCTGVIS